MNLLFAINMMIQVALQCRKVPFENPYPAGHEKHAKLHGRVQYLTHQTRTRSWQLLGFEMPAEKTEAAGIYYKKLSEIPALTALFQAGEGTQAEIVCAMITQIYSVETNET